MRRIPVVFTPDNGFAIPTSVAICSMLDTRNRDTEYYFYIIVGSAFDDSNIKLFEKVLKIYPAFQYEIIRIDDKAFSQLKINTKHLTTSAFYRLFTSSILPEESKVMYHDGDILVLDDLASLFDIEFGDNYVLGVPSIYGVQYGNWRQDRVEHWGFEHTDDYIFSGDLIMNLSLIRKDHLEDLFSEHMTYGYPSEDQDVLNRVCIGRKGKLPLRFCMLTRWAGNDVLSGFDICPYSSEEIENAQSNPAIVHFAGSEAKPWVNLRAKYSGKWWGYLKRIVDPEVYEEWYERALNKTLERDWDHVVGILNDNMSPDNGKYKKEIVVYGFGKAGKQLYSALIANGYNVSAIIDKNKNDISDVAGDTPVLTPEEAVVKFGSSMIFITVQGEYKGISQELRNIGFNDADLVQYIFKADFYYQVLDDSFLQLEEEDTKKRNGIQNDA